MDQLALHVSKALERPCGSDVQTMARHILNLHPGICAVVAYGSTQRDQSTADTLIDFYCLVESRQELAMGAVLQHLGDLVPPNVFYAKTNRTKHVLRCKYAVVTFQKLRQWTRTNVATPYFWVRFCQPMSLVFVRDEAARLAVADIAAQAMRTAYGQAKALLPDADPLAQWEALFAETYRTELRPEGRGRSRSIVDAEPGHYIQISALMADVPVRKGNWMWARAAGKMLTTLRLCKAAFTFSGGSDYVAWKIERHSGAKIVLTPWQRRHPILAGLMLLPKLLLRGVIR